MSERAKGRARKRVSFYGNKLNVSCSSWPRRLAPGVNQWPACIGVRLEGRRLALASGRSIAIREHARRHFRALQWPAQSSAVQYGRGRCLAAASGWRTRGAPSGAPPARSLGRHLGLADGSIWPPRPIGKWSAGEQGAQRRAASSCARSIQLAA